ncbi:GGDEF domain-containing protein [Defluviitalea phaphyphila]|uniref:GGDEF domain-containing protein n=1 Tax=Defluviitalea phaphyphila TaxID=1473580 RepID=UPI000731D382|nr:GGDEF domain-containing protein [Defluviitalea phaphyphila]
MYDFFNRILLITSIVTLNSILFKSYWFKPNKYKKQLLGIVGGLSGILLIIYPYLESNFLTYLSSLWIILSPSFLFGGFISCLISGIIIFIFYSIFYFSLEVFFLTLLFILSCGLFSKLYLNKLEKWIIINILFSIITFIYSKYLLIPYNNILINLLSSIYLIILISIFKKNYHSYFQLKTQATKDFLTEINNSRQFNIILNHTFTCAVKNNQKLSIIILDIDYFKSINDTYGHPAGDKILKQFALILKNFCPTKNIFRIGGEEFCILLPEYSLSKAYDVAEKIRSAVQNHKFKIDYNNYVNITVSIGISNYPSMAKDKETLIKSADEALYEAKKSGRNKVNIPIKIYNK